MSVPQTDAHLLLERDCAVGAELSEPIGVGKRSFGATVRANGLTVAFHARDRVPSSGEPRPGPAPAAKRSVGFRGRPDDLVLAV
jgi:hypothetical protein